MNKVVIQDTRKFLLVEKDLNIILAKVYELLPKKYLRSFTDNLFNLGTITFENVKQISSIYKIKIDDFNLVDTDGKLTVSSTLRS